MRTSIGSTLLSGLLVLAALAFGTPQPAAAATLSIGDCAGATEVDFSPGLTNTLASDAVSINAVFTGCVWTGSPVLQPAPVSFTWSGNLNGVSCIAINSQNPNSAGKLKWEDGSLSNVTFTGLTYAGAVGLVPAVLTFHIDSGYNAGGSFVVTAALVTDTFDLQECLTSQPVKVLTGAITSVTYINGL